MYYGKLLSKNLSRQIYAVQDYIIMLHCDPEVSLVNWRSIWSHLISYWCQFSYCCIWARQRQTRSHTLFAPSVATAMLQV